MYRGGERSDETDYALMRFNLQKTNKQNTRLENENNASNTLNKLINSYPKIPKINSLVLVNKYFRTKYRMNKLDPQKTSRIMTRENKTDRSEADRTQVIQNRQKACEK